MRCEFSKCSNEVVLKYDGIDMCEKHARKVVLRDEREIKEQKYALRIAIHKIRAAKLRLKEIEKRV